MLRYGIYTPCVSTVSIRTINLEGWLSFFYFGSVTAIQLLRTTTHRVIHLSISSRTVRRIAITNDSQNAARAELLASRSTDMKGRHRERGSLPGAVSSKDTSETCSRTSLQRSIKCDFSFCIDRHTLLKTLDFHHVEFVAACHSNLSTRYFIPRDPRHLPWQCRETRRCLSEPRQSATDANAMYS